MKLIVLIVVTRSTIATSKCLQ